MENYWENRRYTNGMVHVHICNTHGNTNLHTDEVLLQVAVVFTTIIIPAASGKNCRETD